MGWLSTRLCPNRLHTRRGSNRGNLILKVDGKLVGSPAEFVNFINSSSGTVTLVVRKGDNGRILRTGLDLLGNKGAAPLPYVLGVLGTFSKDGMSLQTVVNDSPAWKAGLEKNDTILHINDIPLTKPADLTVALAAANGKLTLHIRKPDGRWGNVDVDLGFFSLGVVGQFSRFGMGVQTVAPGSPAEAAGLQPTDLVWRAPTISMPSARKISTPSSGKAAVR